jgi:glycosyltransferase involved in cell wall biosynthesis
VIGLTKELTALGDSVCIIVPGQYEHGVRQELMGGVPVYTFPARASNFRHGVRDGGSLEGWDRIVEFLREWKPDVLHSHSVGTIFQAAEIRQLSEMGVPSMATLHLPSLGYGCSNGTLMRFEDGPCDGLIEPKICAACTLASLGLPWFAARWVAALPMAASSLMDRLPGKVGTVAGMRHRVGRRQRLQADWIGAIGRVVTVARWARQHLIANGVPEYKVTYIETGIEPPFARKPSPDTAPTSLPLRIGYVGRLDPTKGVETLIQAVRSLPPDRPLSLEIYGPGEQTYRNRLRDLIGADSRITLGGIAPGDQVWATMSQLDLLCVPSTWVEMLGLVSLEAFAVGTPVIGSDCGGTAEIVRDGVNGRLFPPGDVQALAAILAEVASEPGLIDRWRRAIRPPRTVGDMANDYRSLYEQISGHKVRG